jgi:hypothetical protein
MLLKQASTWLESALTHSHSRDTLWTTVRVICFSAAMGDGPFLSGFGPLFLQSLIYLHIFKAFYLKTCLSLAKSEMAKSPWRNAATCWHLAAATSMQLLQETCCS